MAAEVVIAREQERAWEDWGELAPERGRVRWKTMLSAGLTASESLTLGLARLRPGETLELHSHPQAEMYLVLAGSPTVAAAGREHELEPGDTVFIPGGVEHGCRNDSGGEVRFAFAFAADSAEEVEYRFAGA